jgi:hypothetical protein
MPVIARFDFGNALTPESPGFIKVGRVYRSPRFLWLNDVREGWRPGPEEDGLFSYVSGTEGEYRLGLPAGTYGLQLTCFDPQHSHGPFTLAVASVPPRAPQGSGQAQVVLQDIVVPEGVLIRRQVRVVHSGGALALRFAAAPGQSFLLNFLEVEGPEGAALQPLFPDAPADVLPSRAEVLAQGRDDAKAALREVCAWLLRQRKPNGFLGDIEGTRQWWYTSAYPIRTFLAAYELFGTKQYLEVSEHILDQLLSEQMPEGGFTQAFRNQPTAALSAAELEQVRAQNWMNLADIGSIVAALIAAIPYVDADRRRRYLDAAKRYCDLWALRFQRPNGGFTNGWLAGHEARNIYSVATANSAFVFAFLGHVSGETGYLEVADRAVSFLLQGWNEDGRPLSWPFDGQFPDHPYYQPVLHFGDQFYTHDGLACALVHTRDDALRGRLFAAMRRWLFGSRGMLATIGEGSWLPLQETWNNSKSAALPIFFQLFLHRGPGLGASAEELARVDALQEVARKFLCTPAYARRIGVMLDDPQDLPWGNHSLQSWTGCAVAATGFAGLALAEMVKPGIVFLA